MTLLSCYVTVVTVTQVEGEGKRTRARIEVMENLREKTRILKSRLEDIQQVSPCLRLMFRCLFLYTGGFVVSYFMWTTALDSSGVILS